MSLINCRECGKEISNSAEKCPNCGAPVNQNVKATPISQMEGKKSGISIAALVLTLLGCTALIGFILAIVDLSKKDGRNKILSKIALGICVAWVAISIVAPKNSDKTTAVAENEVSIEESTQKEIEAVEEETEKQEEEINYIICDVDEMVDALESNAMKAESQYKGQYLEVTGKLNVIDSSGKYIGVYPINNEFCLTGVNCDIDGEEQKNYVMELSKGDTITLRIKCTSVGEVMGYSGDIIEFVE